MTSQKYEWDGSSAQSVDEYDEKNVMRKRRVMKRKVGNVSIVRVLVLWACFRYAGNAWLVAGCEE